MRWIASLLLAVTIIGTVALTWAADPPKSAKKDKPTPSKATAENLLAAQPRPKRPDLAPSTLPLEFIKGERIAFVGNSLAERMNLFGHVETLLHTRYADKELVIRNFARPADEVGIRQRSGDYTKLDDPLYAFTPDTFFCFFGFNESFKDVAGVPAFQEQYEKFLDEYAAKYPRDDTKAKPRFVLISPIAFESSGDPLLPAGTKENERLKAYTAAVAEVAKKRNLAFVDLFTPTLAAFDAAPGLQYTINGAHQNDAGDKLIGQNLVTQLVGKSDAGIDTARLETLRAAIIDKSWVHNQDHRMVNGWYVYGGRRTFDTETFPREYVKLRKMAAVRDARIWAIAKGEKYAEKPDDSATGELLVPPTRFGAPGQKYSEQQDLGPVILPPDEFIKTCTVPAGTKLELFADEKMFPDLAKPVQINFDNKGRLWVSCMPSYPQWLPGNGDQARDKLLILEDTNGDGKADKCTVFYDKLHCPTGFEFFNGGVIVMDQPRLLFLKDTDGDGKADLVVHLLDGWATDDTHHRGGFEWSHGGLLHLLEGIATSTTLETIWGPHRSAGKGGAYVFDPRTQKIRQFALPGQANMWCYVFDEWGQGIVGDGTTATHHWDTPLSGAQFDGRKGLKPVFNQEGMRPALGSEWLVSRALPDDMQKQFCYACVINMNGLPRFIINDDGAGFAGKRMKLADGKAPDDLIRSTHKHFRPADPQIGPDGALWFGDWANPLIGHMQYSQRDPNRDHVHGRIYRLVGTDKPLLKPATQFGKSVTEICEQFREYEWRTRYRARRELHDRPASEVLPAVAAWLQAINPSDPVYDRLCCEALWVQQGHHAVDPALLEKVLRCKTPQARATATHILSDERERFPTALALLKQQAIDEHPRVRTEALRGLSFFPTLEAMEAAVASVKQPGDEWTNYTLAHTLGANEAIWRQAFLTGKLASDVPNAQPILTAVLASSKSGGAAAPFLKRLLSSEGATAEQKNKDMTALSLMKGNAGNGKTLFQRNCITCHRVGKNEGQDYGPNMDKVATKLMTRYKIVESIIEPNAEVDKKYLSTRIDKADGKSITGLLVSESKDEVVIFDGKDKHVIKVKDIEERTTLKQSSMPEGLAGTMAPSEFLDLVEYLATLK